MKKPDSSVDSNDLSKRKYLLAVFRHFKQQLVGYIENNTWATSWRARIRRFTSLDLSRAAAASSFYFLFSLFPMLLFLTSMLNLINPDLPNQIMQVTPELSVVIPETILQMLLNFIEGSLEKTSVSFLSLTAFGLLWSASKGVGSVVNTMNNIYHSKTRYSFLLRRLFGILAILFISLLLIAILLLMTFNRLVLNYLASFIQLPEFFAKSNFNFTANLLSFFTLILLFTVIYHVLGRNRGLLRHTLIAAVFAASGWILISYAMSNYFVQRAAYYNMYGNITGVIFLMLWIYAAILLLMVSAFIHTEMIRKYPKPPKAHNGSRHKVENPSDQEEWVK